MRRNPSAKGEVCACTSRISRCSHVRPFWRVRGASASGSSVRTVAARAARRGTRAGGRRGSRARRSSATPNGVTERMESEEAGGSDAKGTRRAMKTATAAHLPGPLPVERRGQRAQPAARQRAARLQQRVARGGPLRRTERPLPPLRGLGATRLPSANRVLQWKSTQICSEIWNQNIQIGDDSIEILPN